MTATSRDVPLLEGVRRAHNSQRVLGLLTLFLTQVTNYFLRTALSVAIDGDDGIAAEMGWDDADKGLALSAFFYGYVLQFVPGWLTVRFGPRRVLATALLVQAALTFALPMCIRTRSLAVVMWARALDGVMQGAFYPSLSQTIPQWYDGRGRSRAYAIADCGNSVGAVIAMVLAPQIMQTWGWPRVFEVGAMASLAIALGVACLLPGQLASGGGVSVQVDASAVRTLAGVTDDEPNAATACRTPLSARAILCRRKVLLLGPVFFCETYAWYVFLTFLPLYCSNQLGFSPMHSGVAAALPYVALVIGQNGWATLADGLISRSISRRPLRARTHVRKLFEIAGGGSCALLLGFLALGGGTLSSDEVVAVVTSANFAYSASGGGGARLLPLDEYPGVEGLVMGYANAVGNTAGILAPLVTGELLQQAGCPQDRPAANGSLPFAPPHISPACREAWTAVWGLSAGWLAAGVLLFATCF